MYKRGGKNERGGKMGDGRGGKMGDERGGKMGNKKKRFWKTRISCSGSRGSRTPDPLLVRQML